MFAQTLIVGTRLNRLFNGYPQSMFGGNNKKKNIPLQTPVSLC